VVRFQSVVLSLVYLSFSCVLVSAQLQPEVALVELRVAETEPGEGLEEFKVEGKPTLYLHSESVIQHEDIESIRATPSQHGHKDISIRLTASGGRKMAAATETNMGKAMALLHKGTLVSAPIIHSKIERDVLMSGNFSQAEIDGLLEAIQPRPRTPVFDADALQAFSDRMDRAAENRIFSGTVLIAVDGKIVLEKSVGYANVKTKQPFAENSSFRLASVSKQFTAMGIMLLKEDGKLDFDDDIRKHLPSMPYEGVTIRHLLHHNGGLPDYMGLFDRHWDKSREGDNSKEETKTAFNKDFLKLFADRKPNRLFAPEEQHQYSNTGYVLLGSIIEAASGQGIHEFFQERIFKPLEMRDSAVFSPDESIFKPANRVYGFVWDEEGSSSDNDWNYLNGMVGDGGIYSSARDLLKWDQALYGEKLVSQATLRQAFTSGKLNSGEETGYGFGWLVRQSKASGLVVSHGGSWVGFRTAIER